MTNCYTRIHCTKILTQEILCYLTVVKVLLNYLHFLAFITALFGRHALKCSFRSFICLAERPVGSFAFTLLFLADLAFLFFKIYCTPFVCFSSVLNCADGFISCVLNLS